MPTATAYPINSGSFADDGATTCASAGGCREVWRDDRTQLLWSDKLDNPNVASGLIPNGWTFSWCMASGSNNKSGSPYAELDPSSYCGNGTNTDTAYQYGNSQLPVSLCAEDATYLQTPTWADDEKGGLKVGSTPAVMWRLATAYDWKMADLNGVRHVLPRMPYTTYWSSTVGSAYRQYASNFDGFQGLIAGRMRNESFSVRCVGRP